MTKTFKLIIRTPEAEIFNGDAQSIHVTTEGGDLQAMADHASLTGSILCSRITIECAEETHEFMVRRGLFTFHNHKNEATLLATHAEKLSEMKMETVKEYLKFIEEQLRAGNDLSDFQITHLEGEKLAVEQTMAQI